MIISIQEDISNIKPMLSLEFDLLKKLEELQKEGKDIFTEEYKGYSFPRVYEYCEE